jgi:hypothetical protein
VAAYVAVNTTSSGPNYTTLKGRHRDVALKVVAMSTRVLASIFRVLRN